MAGSSYVVLTLRPLGRGPATRGQSELRPAWAPEAQSHPSFIEFDWRGTGLSDTHLT